MYRPLHLEAIHSKFDLALAAHTQFWQANVSPYIDRILVVIHERFDEICTQMKDCAADVLPWPIYVLVQPEEKTPEIEQQNLYQRTYLIKELNALFQKEGLPFQFTGRTAPRSVKTFINLLIRIPYGDAYPDSTRAPAPLTSRMAPPPRRNPT